MRYDVEQIMSELGIDYIMEPKEKTISINGFSSLDESTRSDLSFCLINGEEGLSSIHLSHAGAILCKRSMMKLFFPNSLNKQLIFVNNPRLAFIQIVKHVRKAKKMVGISPSAEISESAQIGKDCYIGSFVSVGENCTIGDNTIIQDKVSILPNTMIGKNCLIQPSVTIGADGFGFERYPESLALERFPHFGGVVIEDDVEISANTSIARGSLSNTKIGKGTKIDALVHVAHNVEIGTNCEITAGSIIGGSTVVGNNCWLGLNCTLKNKIKLGDNVIIACGAAVIGNVCDKDIVAGVPAVSIKSKAKLGKCHQ
jgi:UDP-3-O-[3-hydroxymyristoyl] glucosamine N-acyltransferase